MDGGGGDRDGRTDGRTDGWKIGESRERESKRENLEERPWEGARERGSKGEGARCWWLG
jgi:hypothetical protein